MSGNHLANYTRGRTRKSKLEDFGGGGFAGAVLADQGVIGGRVTGYTGAWRFRQRAPRLAPAG
jgi:hypothetical protein